MAEENLKIALLEKQILHCLLENNELLEEKDIDCFISPQAQEFYFDLLHLKNEGKKVIAENILTLDNQFLTSELVIAVQSTDYDIKEFDSYISKLETKALIHEFKSDTLSDLSENESDFEKLDKIRSRIDELEQKKSKNEDTSSFPKLIQEYKEEIKKRASGNKNTTGDYNLDKLIGGFDAGIILLLGMSGSMKSTLTIKILRNRITKRLPTCAINTELTHATYMDTLVSTMINEDYNTLRGYDRDEDDFTDWDGILAKLDELESVYARKDNKRKMFDFYPSNSVSIADIKSFCRKCRKDFRLKKDETLFCSIDLLLMIKDMNKSGTSRADAITQGINELNEFALTDNILFFATVQAKRKSHTVKIEKIEDLNEFRLSTEVIKESASLEERSRAILSLHNPKYLANKNPCSQLIRDLVDPILELTVIKNSWQENLGQTIYYYIDSEHKDLIDYIPKDGEIPNSGNFNTESTETESEQDDAINRLEKQLED
jgi:hypothetical protein